MPTTNRRRTSRGSRPKETVATTPSSVKAAYRAARRIGRLPYRLSSPTRQARAAEIITEEFARLIDFAELTVKGLRAGSVRSKTILTGLYDPKATEVVMDTLNNIGEKALASIQ